jgi:RHS repeat-associated protein
MAYDGAGRQYQTRTVLSMSKAPYSTAETTEGKFLYRAPDPATILTASTGDDGVMEIDHSVFDARGNVIHQHMFEANHDDTNGIHMSADKYVRRTVYNWYDGADRITTSADYGSGNGNNSLDRWGYAALPSYPGSAPTDSGLMQLVIKYAYNADTGRQELMTDPANRKTKMFFDDLGRQTYVAKNWADFTPETGAGDGSDSSKDVVTKFEYNGLGAVTKQTVLNVGGSNQATEYFFEDPVAADRVTKEVYPDSANSTDRILLEYNVDGTLKKKTDQRQTVLEYTYNERRQRVLEAATSLGGADSHVKAIGRSYDNIGRLTKVTSYGTDTVSTTIRNEVALTYNDLDQVTVSEQSHEGATDGSKPKVQYGYHATLNNNVYRYQHRLQTVTYPGASRTVFYDYDTGNEGHPANRLSRVRSLRSVDGSGTEWARYSHNGTSRLISVDYPQIGLKLDYSQAATNGTYVGLDRFGRIADQYWKQTSADIDRFKYEYDYASSPKFKDNLLTNDRDQLYAYDGLHRLTTYDQGQLESGAIGSPVAGQDWSLDALGNWTGFDSTVGGTLNQIRDVNDANEITNVTEGMGQPAWLTPAYDNAGNMTSSSMPGFINFSRTVTYDAWNRVIEVKFNGSVLIEKYEYDGLNRRIVRTPGSGDILHSYYNEDWQELEVRKESGSEDPDPFEQFVWHPYYIDALATRFYDENVDGASVAQHYFTHDANFNVTAAVSTTPAVAERYDYTPYGSLKFLDSSFAALTTQASTIGNAYSYTGRRFDQATGMYYYRHRNYDPDLGNFVSRDPIGYEGGDNLYEYANSNGLSQTDPDGRNPLIAGGRWVLVKVCQRVVVPAGKYCANKAGQACKWVWRKIRAPSCAELSAAKIAACNAAKAANGCGNPPHYNGLTPGECAILAALWSTCEAARQAYQAACFKPSDPAWKGHMTQIKEVARVVAKCSACAGASP